MASLFLAQAVGIDLSWQQQLVMVGVMMLTSKGTAGIAGGAFIVLASTFTAVGHIPLAALALIVGIDRLLNEGRVFINVLGNAMAAMVSASGRTDSTPTGPAKSCRPGQDKNVSTSRAEVVEADKVESRLTAAPAAGRRHRPRRSPYPPV